MNSKSNSKQELNKYLIEILLNFNNWWDSLKEATFDTEWLLCIKSFVVEDSKLHSFKEDTLPWIMEDIHNTYLDLVEKLNVQESVWKRNFITRITSLKDNNFLLK